MNRRRFLGTLFGLAAAPIVAARVLTLPPKQKYEVYRGRSGGMVWFNGKQFLESGYVYAPYVPLHVSSVPIKSEVRKLKWNWNIEKCGTRI